jgi:hypothetical protein
VVATAGTIEQMHRAAGDVVYNGVHQYLVESRDGGRDAWRRAIDAVEALGAGRIVAGHKNREHDDDAGHN